MKIIKTKISKEQIKIIKDIIYFGSSITHAGSYFIDTSGKKHKLDINIYEVISDIFSKTIENSDGELPEDIYLLTKEIFNFSINNLGSELETVTGYSVDEVSNFFV